MTVAGGTIVAFSAVHSVDAANVERAGNDVAEIETPQKPAGTPILLQVSIVKTEARLMSSEEFEKAMKFINEAKSTMKETFTKAKKFYDDKNIGGAIKAIQGVGDIVGGVMKFLPEEEDPMVKNLSDLESDVKHLSEKLTDNFNEMKALISEQTFFTNIMNPTAVLTKHMRDCLKTPGDDAKENFRKAYKANKPLKLQYDLNSYLQHKTTNPVKVSMDSEKVKTKATFEKWEDIISRVMAQFILLEAFAKGLLGLKFETNFDRLITASKEIFANMDSWKEEYKKDQAYWDELKEFLEPYIESHTNLNNAEKGAEISTKLNNYLTSDAFYLFIFNEAKWNEWYTYLCANESDQIVGSWHKGKCVCFIYRSRTGSTASPEAYQTIMSQVIRCAHGVLRSTGTLQNMIKTQLIDPNLLPGNGFIGVIDAAADPKIFHFNSPGPDALNHGPGHYGFALMDVKDGHRAMTLIAGFP